MKVKVLSIVGTFLSVVDFFHVILYYHIVIISKGRSVLIPSHPLKLGLVEGLVVKPSARPNFK